MVTISLMQLKCHQRRMCKLPMVLSSLHLQGERQVKEGNIAPSPHPHLRVLLKEVGNWQGWRLSSKCTFLYLKQILREGKQKIIQRYLLCK